MNSIWYSLVWKEWREHRWKLASLTAVYIVTIFIAGFAAEDSLFGAASVTFSFMAPLASGFVAMGIAAGEQGRGTIGFLQALPTRVTRPAMAKMVMALITVVAPLIAAVALTYILGRLDPPAAEAAAEYDLLMYGTSWGLKSWYAARALAVALGSASILIWMAAAGVNRSDEVRAGAVGLLAVMVVWSGLVLAGGLLFPEYDALPGWWIAVYSVCPGAVAAVGNRLNPTNLAEFQQYGGWAAVSALVVHLALGAWYIRRFGRVARAQMAPAEEQRSAHFDKAWLAPPRSGPIAAIVWKQVRESGPLAILGAAMTVAATLIFSTYLLWSQGNDVDGVAIITSVTGWAFVGLFVSLVAGIGLFMDDLQPRLNAFWRSRPIGVDQWFCVKFITGAVTTLATLAAPPILVLTVATLAGLRLDDHERMIDELLEFAPTMISVQLELFCLAVAAIILVRQALYAAILALAAAGLVLAVCARLELLGDFHLLTAMWIASAAAIVIAWLAVRNDWGWKH